MPKVYEGQPWLKWEHGLPRFIVHEQHEKKVKWALRFLTAFGISLSVVTMPWYWSLGISIALVAVDLVLESTAFYFTSLYVTAFPDKRWDGSKWLAMTFLIRGEPDDPESSRTIGMAFSDKDFATSVFEMLRTWNDGEAEDKNGNICLSFVFDENGYYTFIYPSFDKKSIRREHRKLERKAKSEKPGKDHFGLIMSMILCKYFEIGSPISLLNFVEHQKQGKPFVFCSFFMEPGGRANPMYDVQPLILFRYKVKHYSQLTDEDIELVHYRRLIVPNR
jgi:hypothetical protein